MVYFIQCETYVKVGYTGNMKTRYKKYVTENPFPLKIVGLIKGGYAIEKKIHKQLETWKHRGEWFIYNDLVKERIREIIKENAGNQEVKEPRRKRKKRKSSAISLKGKTVK